jgi:hypothetical protein
MVFLDIVEDLTYTSAERQKTFDRGHVELLMANSKERFFLKSQISSIVCLGIRKYRLSFPKVIESNGQTFKKHSF